MGAQIQTIIDLDLRKLRVILGRGGHAGTLKVSGLAESLFSIQIRNVLRQLNGVRDVFQQNVMILWLLDGFRVSTKAVKRHRSRIPIPACG